MNIFWVLRFCEYFFFFFFLGGGGGGGSTQYWTIFRGHFYACILGSLLRSRYRMGNIFLVAKI